MAEVNQRNAVEKVARIAARPETVFQYFVDPVKMLRWKGIEAELEPDVGGRYRVKMSEANIVSGIYVEIVPPSRVVFTWGWEGSGSVPPGSTTVEVTLEPDGEGTLLRLRHYDLPDEEQRKLHKEGWDHYVDRLVVAAGGGDPGPDNGMDPSRHR